MVAGMALTALVLSVFAVFWGATDKQVAEVKEEVNELDEEYRDAFSNVRDFTKCEKARLDALSVKLTHATASIAALQEVARTQKKQIDELMAIVTSPAPSDKRLTKLESGFQHLAMALVTVGEGIQAAETLPPSPLEAGTRSVCGDCVDDDEDDEDDEPTCEGCDCPKDDCQCTADDDEEYDEDEDDKDDEDDEEDDEDEDDDDDDEDEEEEEEDEDEDDDDDDEDEEEEEEDEDDDPSDHDEDCDCKDCK